MPRYHHYLSLIISALPILILSLWLYRYTENTAAVIEPKAISTTTAFPTTSKQTTTTATTATTQAEVRYVGALPEFLSEFPLNANGLPQNYTRIIEGTACAYTAASGAVTATGTTPRIGTVAVNPRIIPYGSKLFIVSDSGYCYGYAVAEDTGGDLLNNSILVDLYMDTREDCLAFGRRRVKIYILE